LTNIKVAIVGIGNCASSLIQGIYYYKNKLAKDSTGLMHHDIGGFKPENIDIVAAFDVDQRKVGLDVNEAIFAAPNCTIIFCRDIPKSGTIVQMGLVSDGFSTHMNNYPEDQTFVLSRAKELDKAAIVKSLKDTNCEVLMNYLPVGSQRATEFYAECCLEAGVAFVNNIPVFIASNPVWEKRFADAGIPIIGDDIKAQLGATITHRTLTDLFHKRGVKLERTYQLNTGGNTDFLNMQNSDRLESKKKSKTEAVQAVAEHRLADHNIHVGPSDYVSWQNDNKVCFIRMEGKLFGGVPMNLEMRLSVEDSPNSAGVAIDMIRCAKLAKDRGQSGVIHPPSSYFCKHPPRQIVDNDAFQEVEDFIAG